MAGAMRRAVLGHLRVPVVSHTSFSHSLHGSEKKLSTPILVRIMSFHDDHLTKDQVIQRVLAVIKDFPKVDPSKWKVKEIEDRTWSISALSTIKNKAVDQQVYNK